MLTTERAAGRLGNRVFQNLVVSHVARALDLRARYSLLDECQRLGLELYSGSQDADGSAPEVALTDELVEQLVEGNWGALPSGRPRFAPVAWGAWFQTPAIARFLRVHALEPARRANTKYACPNDDVFVHVRLGDMAVTAARPAEDYIAAVRACGATGTVWVASDSLSSPTVRRVVRSLGARTVARDPVDTILFGSSRAHLVLSDGTFSWCIAALAPHPRSVCYLPRSVVWHGDIFVFDDWVRR